MTEDLLYFNGINGATGEFLPPFTPKQISKIAQGEEFDPLLLVELKQRYDRDQEQHYGLGDRKKDPKDLADAGWGVIFAYGADLAIRDALSVLLEHRQKQATQKKEHYYQEYIGPKAYRLGESKQDFLKRHRIGLGPANPEKMPYYLLIVGDPETIPYEFQYQLDVQYAVGRIYFDSLEEYAQYAQSVVEAETGELSLPRTVSFFGVRNSGDQATQSSADRLITPVAEWIAQDQPNWSVQTILRDEATKARLSQLVGGAEKPALLFTASHGVCFPKDHCQQLPHQGSLLCQDWPGPFKWKGELDPEKHYFSADDVGDNAQLHGLIAFQFACYGAGTPKFDNFSHQPGSQRSEIAPHAFIARLPQRLLSHPKGGALAVIGHVERAFEYSFKWKRAEQLETFQYAIQSLMEGYPVGFATEFFNERYAEFATDINENLENIKHNETVDDWNLANLWAAHHDARNYVIIGDPAVRLQVRTASSVSGEQFTPEKIVINPLDSPSPENSKDAEETPATYSHQEDLQNVPDSFKRLVEDLDKRVKLLERQVQRLQDQNLSLQQQINRL